MATGSPPAPLPVASSACATPGSPAPSKQRSASKIPFQVSMSQQKLSLFVASEYVWRATAVFVFSFNQS